MTKKISSFRFWKLEIQRNRIVARFCKQLLTHFKNIARRSVDTVTSKVFRRRNPALDTEISLCTHLYHYYHTHFTTQHNLLSRPRAQLCARAVRDWLPPGLSRSASRPLHNASAVAGSSTPSGRHSLCSLCTQRAACPGIRALPSPPATPSPPAPLYPSATPSPSALPLRVLL